MRVLRGIVASDSYAGLIVSEHPTELLNDTFSFLQHLAVPKSGHFKTASFEVPSSRIVIAFLFVRVLFSVEFDDQARRDTAEIDDERIDRYLSAEFPAVELSILKNRPEPLLSFGGVTTECARTRERFLRDKSWRREISHPWTISLFLPT